MAGRIAKNGLLLALAFLCSHLEALLPSPAALPGFKLGLANLPVVIALYLDGLPTATAVSFLRIGLMGLTFSAPSTILFGLAGGVCSLLCMTLCRKSGRFSVVGVSAAGGAAHNLGQCLAALTVLTPESIGRLCPFLTAAGCAAGAAIGGVCLPILRRLLLPNGEKPHGYPDAGID